MTTSKTAADIWYPRAAIAETITLALSPFEKHDYSHVTEWICPCWPGRHPGAITAGQWACMNQAAPEGHLADSCERWKDCAAPPEAHGCRGNAVLIPLPPDRAITIEDLVAVLPEAAPDGTVSAVEAGNVLGALASARLRDQPYRRRQLFAVLGTAFDELDAAMTGKPMAEDTGAAPDPSRPRCDHCNGLIPPERGPQARYCDSKCRQKAWKRRRKEQQPG